MVTDPADVEDEGKCWLLLAELTDELIMIGPIWDRALVLHFSSPPEKEGEDGENKNFGSGGRGGKKGYCDHFQSPSQ